MDWFIRIRKSDTDVAVTAINALILVFSLAGIKAFVYDFKDFIYDFDAFLEVLFREIHFLNVVIAPCKTDKSSIYIDIVVLFNHNSMQHQLEFVGFENSILKLGKFIFKRRCSSVIEEQNLIHDPFNVVLF